MKTQSESLPRLDTTDSLTITWDDTIGVLRQKLIKAICFLTDENLTDSQVRESLCKLGFSAILGDKINRKELLSFFDNNLEGMDELETPNLDESDTRVMSSNLIN